MTATNGWPGKPGVPLNPEKDGWHWQKSFKVGSKLVASFWCASEMVWQDGPMTYVTVGIAAQHHYLGPCLTPDEATELQARAVKWAGIVGTLMAERNQLIGALQIAVERSGDLEPRPSWVDGACGLLNRGFLKVDRAALDQASALQARVADLEGALQKIRNHARTGRPPFMSTRVDYFQIASTALEGKKE